jgi:carbon storage regulator
VAKEDHFSAAGGEWKAPLPVRREYHMLVLRRKAGEAIVLNGTITIHVLAVEGERVKLGISAPPEVVIVRSELLEEQEPVSRPDGSSPNEHNASSRGPQAFYDEQPASQNMFTLEASSRDASAGSLPNSSGARIPRRRTSGGPTRTPVSSVSALGRPNSSRYR